MSKSIVLVAGGTGGHIWPAISFGKWIEKHHDDYAIHHICGNRKLEMEIHTAAGTSPYILDMDGSPLGGRNLFQKISRCFSLGRTYLRALKYLKKVKPSCCILFAGYISFPVLLACKTLGIYVVLHEQNAYAGRVTRIAAKMGVEIYSGWKQCQPLPEKKFTPIGIPVRTMKEYLPEEAWKELGFNCELPATPRVVVMTGSLGSNSIKNTILDISSKAPFNKWSFILPAVAEKNECINDNIYLLPKTWNIAPLYALSDMLIVRAGGSTLAEVAQIGKPAMIIPWLKSCDSHQSYNATSFASDFYALIYDENSTKEDFEKKLSELAIISSKYKKNIGNRMYNNMGSVVCENLWFALSPKFEGRTLIVSN